jgi:regulator of sirC expression with transglutaminase-like and TPR domain
MTHIEKEVASLLKLLNDENHFVSESASHRLYEIADNQAICQQLMEATDGEDVVLQLKVRKILDTRRNERYQEEFQIFASKKDIDLEEGCCLIAQEDYDATESEFIRLELDQLAEELRPQFEKASNDDEKVQCLIDFFYRKKNFNSDRKNFYCLDNAFLNRVIASKSGIPITLGITLMLIAKRLGFQLHPISVPTHFLLHYGNNFDENFIDPFNEGKKLNRQDCYDFLKRVGVIPHHNHLEAANNRQIIARILRHLAAIYHQAQAHQHALIIEQRIEWILDR